MKGCADMKKIQNIELALLTGMLITIILSGFCSFDENYNEITDNVFRLHILANSDSNEDQELKLKVRDAVLKNTSYLFDESMSKEETINTVEQHMNELNQIAKKTIAENGYSYSVKCEITEMYFDKKIYEDITMPQGNYSALRITIGEAKGHNWWCVMFPPLCLPAVTNTEEILEEYGDILTKEEVDMLQNPENYEVRFYFVDLVSKLTDDNGKNTENAEIAVQKK